MIVNNKIVLNAKTLNHSKIDLLLSHKTLLNDILPDLIAIGNECMSLIEFSWIRYAAKHQG